MNHLGVEVECTDEVAAATARLAAEGMVTATEDQVACCYAVQDKVWVDAPTGSHGRSTPCSATSSTPPASSARSSPARTPCAAGPPPSPLSAAAEPWPACSSLSTSPTWTRRSPSTPSCSHPTGEAPPRLRDFAIAEPPLTNGRMQRIRRVVAEALGPPPSSWPIVVGFGASPCGAELVLPAPGWG